MTDSKSLNDALDMLSEISERARELGLGLAEYPVEDVERVITDAMLTRFAELREALEAAAKTFDAIAIRSARENRTMLNRDIDLNVVKSRAEFGADTIREALRTGVKP